jgi:hypothetical protein
MKMQGKRKPHALLMGMQTSITTVEISMKIPQKTKTRPTSLCHGTTLENTSEGV